MILPSFGLRICHPPPRVPQRDRPLTTPLAWVTSDPTQPSPTHEVVHHARPLHPCRWVEPEEAASHAPFLAALQALIQRAGEPVLPRPPLPSPSSSLLTPSRSTQGPKVSR